MSIEYWEKNIFFLVFNKLKKTVYIIMYKYDKKKIS